MKRGHGSERGYTVQWHDCMIHILCAFFFLNVFQVCTIYLLHAGWLKHVLPRARASRCGEADIVCRRATWHLLHGHLFAHGSELVCVCVVSHNIIL